MRVRHFNCATMCPRAVGRLVSGEAGVRPRLVGHVLVVETHAGLLLVDTGFGVEDCRAPLRRVGPSAALLGGSFDERETALHQVLGLGHAARDVTHIVVTHLDSDHAGGLPDFPNATVHVLAREREAAAARRSLTDRARYRAAHFRHDPRWRLHEPSGERWRGFEAVRALEGSKDEILLVPLAGHSAGHAGVAVKTDEGWLLHCGDAYFHARELSGEDAPFGLELFQRTLSWDDALRRANRDRLRELARTAGDVRVFCAHSAAELEALRGGT